MGLPFEEVHKRGGAPNWFRKGKPFLFDNKQQNLHFPIHYDWWKFLSLIEIEPYKSYP